MQALFFGLQVRELQVSLNSYSGDLKLHPTGQYKIDGILQGHCLCQGDCQETNSC